MAAETYRSTYFWTDEGELSRAFGLAPVPCPIVVDVAAGPNSAPGMVLAKLAPGSLYVPLDPEGHHLRLLCRELGGRCSPVLGRGSCFPFPGRSVDVVLYHHGIDDVYETEGRGGLQRSLREAWRTLRPDGLVVVGHCVFSYDPSTKEVSVEEVARQLTALGGEIAFRSKGARMEWLAVRKRLRA